MTGPDIQPDVQPDVQHDDELAALLAEVGAEHSLAGISAGVVVGDHTYVATVGVTDTTHPRDVDADTLFMIGSTSKTFTATALLALVDRGDLALTDRVADHLDDFRLLDEEVAASVTLEQLLNHTGGWRGDLQVDSGWGDDAMARAMAQVATSPQELPLGTLASYSNSGFVVAGQLLASRTGTTFEQAVRDLVLSPLGLGNTHYFPWEVAHRPHAVGHIVKDGAAVSVPIYPAQRWLGPAGGLWSSLSDQLAYLRYHLDGTTSGTAPLSEASRLRMQQASVATSSTIDGIGLSWLLNHQGDVRLVTHGGNVSNVHTSAFAFAPDHGLGLTVLTNGKHGATVGAKVQAWALERFLGVGPAPELPTVPFSAAELAGHYDLGALKWSLVADGDRLLVDLVIPDGVSAEVRIAFTTPPRELVAIGPDVFALATAPTSAVLDVRRAPDGTVEGIVHGMRFARRLGS